MRRRTAATVLALTALPVMLVNAPPTSASGTAMVRIVDTYTHGQVTVTINGVTRRLANGDRVGPLAITPDPMGNDGITVRRVKDSGCGIAVVGKYFRAGQRYRVRINNYRGGRCHAGGQSIPGPSPHVDKLS